MALTFTIQGGMPPPPPSTTPLACWAFNGIDAHEGSLLSLMGGGFFGLPPPPLRKFLWAPMLYDSD